MRPLLGDDVVRIPDRAQTVRHHDHRAAPVKPVQVLHDLFLVVGVQGIRRLVQEDKLRILVHRTGDQDTLPLPLANAVPFHADPRVVAQRQRVDELPDIRHRNGMQQPLPVDRFSPHRNVTRDRVREDEAVLHHTPRMRTPHMRVHILQQDVPHADRPLVRLVETKQQLDKRRLPAAARPHHSRHLVLRDREADMLQHIVTVRPVIAEAHILHPERPLFREPVRFQGKRLFLILLLMDLAEPLQADLRILKGTRKADELLDRSRQLPYDIRQRHHHAQRHFARNNSPRRQKGDQDIRGLVECLFAEVLDGIAATVVLRDHAQARGTAVGGFELVGMGECIEHFYLI